MAWNASQAPSGEEGHGERRQGLSGRSASLATPRRRREGRGRPAARTQVELLQDERPEPLEPESAHQELEPVALPVDAVAVSVEDADDRLAKGEDLACRKEVQER